MSLDIVAWLSGWATPAAQEVGGTPEQFLARKRKLADAGTSICVSLTSLSLQAQLAAWATPRAEDEESAGMRHGRGKANTLTEQAVYLAGSTGQGQMIHGPARFTVSGEMQTGCDAGMRAGGQLHPAHSRWLMGYAPAWDDYGVTAMPWSRKSRKSLLQPYLNT